MNKFVYLSFTYLVLAVILGAFGAHAFKEVLSPEKLTSYEVGVRYQFYVGIIGLIISLNGKKFNASKLKISNYLLFIGGLLFSGSIYLLAFIQQGILRKIAIPLTPIGGLCIILAILFFAYSYYKQQNKS